MMPPTQRPLRLSTRRASRWFLGLVGLLGLFASVQAQKTTGYVISGTVLGSDGGVVAAASVMATSDRPCGDNPKEEVAVAGGDGHFQLRVPCPGVWRLSGEAPGYPKQMYEQHGAFSTGIALSVDQPEQQVIFRMVESSSVSGTVMDEVGDAVRDAKVFLLLPNSLDGTLRTLDQRTTDDRGTYEFTGLTPGDYKIAVQVQPWYAVAALPTRGGGSSVPSNAMSTPQLDMSLDLTYPITFYPNATDAASSATVEVAGGASQQADVHLSPVPSVHVVIPGGGRTTLSFTGGARPLTRGGGSAPAIQQLADFGALRFDPTSVSLLPDGSLDVGGFSPGDYSLASSRSHDDGTQQSFTVAKDAGRTMLLSNGSARQQAKLQTTGTLEGAVELAHKPCHGALLLLVPVAGGEAHVRRQQSNTDGSFTFEQVPLGKYILVGLDQGWSLGPISREAVNAYLVSGVPVDFTGSSKMRIALQAQVP